jgi:hypothetical protein
VDATLAAISQVFPDSQLLEQHDLSLKLKLDSTNSLSAIFRQLEKLRDQQLVTEYSVNQTSLEQIFIDFAREQVEEQGDTAVGDGFLSSLVHVTHKRNVKI